MTDDDVVEKLRSKIGQVVNFEYPGGQGDKSGPLKDRAVVQSNPGSTGPTYWDVIDLIELKEKGKKSEDWIRIGYYKEVKGRLTWARAPVATWKRLLLESASQEGKEWLRDLLNEVVAELRDRGKKG